MTLSLNKDNVYTLTVCPVCSSKAFEEFSTITFRGTTLCHNYCKSCSHYFMSPVPVQSWYDNYYQNEFWESKTENVNESFKKKVAKLILRGKKFIDIINKSNAVLPEGGIFLEIGCAQGFVVSTVAKYFKSKPVGVEPSKKAAAIAKQFAEVDIIGKTISDIKIPFKSLDLIILSHVLENIVDINGTLDTIKNFVKDSGIVIIDTVETNFNKGNLHIHHPHSFTGNSLFFLLEKHGFEVLEIKNQGRPNYFFRPRYLTAVFKISIKNFNKGIIKKTNETSNVLNIVNIIFSSRLMGYLDRFLAKTVYALSKDEKRFIDENEFNIK